MGISSLGLSSLPSLTFNKSSSQIFKSHSFPKPTNTQKSPSLHLHNTTFFAQNGLPLNLSAALIAALCATPFPCFAATETINNKIDLESILASIDDFNNRNPFFVAGVAFIWLVAIPLTQNYFKKYKFASAIDAFQILRNDANAQLLDIRDKKSLLYLGSPNLKILNKKTVQVQFLEGEEEGFVKKVLQEFKDPGSTTVCILDNFDGNSMKVAELLFKNGFKEAYAIRGGLRGKKGWQAIQETLLPPSTHVFPKNGETSKQPETKEGTNLLKEHNDQSPSTKATVGSSGYLSPYPNYPDLKPPSSPTPSKP